MLILSRDERNSIKIRIGNKLKAVNVRKSVEIA